MGQVMDIRRPVFLNLWPGNVAVISDKYVAVIFDKYVPVITDKNVAAVLNRRRPKK